MNKLDLAKLLARESHRSSAQAADEVDTLVHKMLTNLERAPGKPSRPPKGDPQRAARPAPKGKR